MDAEEQLKEISEEDKKKADEFKDQANKEFAGTNFRKAIALYTEAIELNPYNAVYHGNRAFAHIKLENYGSALLDSNECIRLDPKYIKGYYRRGSANFVLGKLKESKEDFKAAAKLEPNNREARQKLADVEKALKAEMFQKAIGGLADSRGTCDPLSNPGLDPANCQVPASYEGPRIAEDGKVNVDFVNEMIAWFKKEKNLDKKYMLIIVRQAHKILEAERTVMDVEVPQGTHITVCGDVHGQFYDLLNIFEINGKPAEDNPYLFNGDFVDRGSFSVETILTLLAFKVLYPSAMHLNRGNHETKNMTSMYGFEGEVKAKCGEGVIALFGDLFQCLPLAHVIGGKVLVQHGGLFSKDETTLDEIRKINRRQEPPDSGPFCECLWSDPQPQNGRSPSKRGVGIMFGPDVAERFFKANGLELLIRSHECKDEGYELEHGGKTITVFSAPNYCDQMGNKGAFIKLKEDLKPEYTTFSAVPHPAVRPMQYAGMGGFNFMNLIQ